MKDCPFKPWELIHTFIVIRWIKTLYDWSGNSLTTIEKMEDICFQTAYSDLGLKPISKCTIEELQAELSKRMSTR